jgi:hypothetical protein
MHAPTNTSAAVNVQAGLVFRNNCKKIGAGALVAARPCFKPSRLASLIR